MRILIVEDERKIARALDKALRQEKYAVDLSFDGTDGFAMASVIEYDLIILDRMLPGDYDGISMTKKLRETGIKTPILMLTALSSIKNKTDGLDAGADDYLTKPFALEELLARARALLRRPKETTEAVLQVGDLTLDPATHQVQRAEQNIELTNKEFSLLEYLMRNSGRALSKDQIITHVWNYDSDILPNNVEVYVKFLREKIDRPFVEKSQPLLKTIRGFGYKLEAN